MKLVIEKKSKCSILKSKSKQDRLNQWKNHFSNLLGQAPPIINNPTKRVIDVELHIEKNDFTMKELHLLKFLITIFFDFVCFGATNVFKYC